MYRLPVSVKEIERFARWLLINNLKAKQYGPQRFLRGRTNAPLRHGAWFQFISIFVVERVLRQADDLFRVELFWHEYFYLPGKYHAGQFALPELSPRQPHACMTAEALYRMLPFHQQRQAVTSLGFVKQAGGTSSVKLFPNNDGFPCELLRPISSLLRGEVVLSATVDSLVLISQGVAAVVTRTQRGKDGTFVPKLMVQKLDSANHPVGVTSRPRGPKSNCTTSDGE